MRKRKSAIFIFVPIVGRSAVCEISSPIAVIVIMAKLGGVEDRFGVYLCVECANLPCVDATT